MKILRLVCLSCFFFLVAAPCHAQVNEVLGTINFPKDDPRTMQCLDELQVGFLRWNVWWEELEKTKGVYDFDTLEMQMSPYYGRDILVTVITRNPLYCAPYCRGDARLAQYPVAGGLPNDLASYRIFITAFADRFGSHISFLQIDNEISRYGIHWQSEIRDYTQVLQAAYAGVKSSSSPGLPVVAAGFASSMLNALLERSGSGASMAQEILSTRSFDYLDLHFYHRYQDIDAKVALFKTRGFTNLISTECSGPDLIEGPVADFQAQKSAQLVKRFSILLQNGLKKISWLSFMDLPNENERFSSLGLVDLDYAKNPAFYTYKLFNKKVGSAVSVSKLGEGKYRFLVEGRPVFVLWSETGPVFLDGRRHVSTRNVLVTHIITAAGKTDADAVTEIVPAGNIRIDDIPIFVEEVK